MELDPPFLRQILVVDGSPASMLTVVQPQDHPSDAPGKTLRAHDQRIQKTSRKRMPRLLLYSSLSAAILLLKDGV
jgi:hypothetical protein